MISTTALQDAAHDVDGGIVSIKKTGGEQCGLYSEECTTLIRQFIQLLFIMKQGNRPVKVSN